MEQQQHKQQLIKRILTVDDELDSNMTLKLVLEDNGFNVDSFNDPLLALDNFKAGSYCLLILDVRMPKMNGFELYKQIKKVDDKVKTMFLTALTDLREYEEFRKEVSPKLGERYYVPKPIENEELIKRVNKILSQIENN